MLLKLREIESYSDQNIDKNTHSILHKLAIAFVGFLLQYAAEALALQHHWQVVAILVATWPERRGLSFVTHEYIDCALTNAHYHVVIMADMDKFGHAPSLRPIQFN